MSRSPAAAAPATPSWPRIRTALAAPTLGPTGSFALVSVLGYRSVAIWLPAPIGLAALVSQRQTLARWAGTTHLVAMDEHPTSSHSPGHACTGGADRTDQGRNRAPLIFGWSVE